MSDRPTFSASNLLRRKRCPGSLRLESQMAPVPDSEWSEEGTMLHNHMAHPELSREKLSDDQRDLLALCENLESDFLETVLAKHKT